MTISPWTIYLITMLDKIGTLFTTMFVLSCLIMLVASIFYAIYDYDLDKLKEKQEDWLNKMGQSNEEYKKSMEENKDGMKGAAKIFKITLLSAIIFGIAIVAIPSTKQAYTILAVPAIVDGGGKVINSQTVDKSVDLINQYLDKKLKETKGD